MVYRGQDEIIFDLSESKIYHLDLFEPYYYKKAFCTLWHKNSFGVKCVQSRLRVCAVIDRLPVSVHCSLFLQHLYFICQNRFNLNTLRRHQTC